MRQNITSRTRKQICQNDTNRMCQMRQNDTNKRGKNCVRMIQTEQGTKCVRMIQTEQGNKYVSMIQTERRNKCVRIRAGQVTIF